MSESSKEFSRGDIRPGERDRRALGFEVATVLLVTVLPIFASTLESLYAGWGSSYLRDGSIQACRLGILRFLLSLLLVAYVIYHRGDCLKDFGLEFRVSILWMWPALFVGAVLLSLAAVYAIGPVFSFETTAEAAIAKSTVPKGIPPGLNLAYLISGSTFEELLVRAYFMTRLRHLGWSAASAVVLSTAVQASYHVYQGPFEFTVHLPVFLLFSIYFARYRNAFVIVLAHICLNLLGWIAT